MNHEETDIDALDLPSAITEALAAGGRECLTIERLQRKDRRELCRIPGISAAAAKAIGHAITTYRIRTGQAGNGFNRYTRPGERRIRITLDDSEQALIESALAGRARELQQLLELEADSDVRSHKKEQTRIRWLLSKIAPKARPSDGTTEPPEARCGSTHQLQDTAKTRRS